MHLQSHRMAIVMSMLIFNLLQLKKTIYCQLDKFLKVALLLYNCSEFATNIQKYAKKAVTHSSMTLSTS